MCKNNNVKMLRKNSVKILQKNNANISQICYNAKISQKEDMKFCKKKHSNFVKNSVHFKDFSFNWLAQLTRFG